MRRPVVEIDLPEVVEGEADGIATLYLPSASTTHHVMLAFRVGRADEQLASSGITHLVEHLAFPASASGISRSNGWVSDTMTAFATRGNELEVRAFVSQICEALATPPIGRLEHEKRVIATEQSSQGLFPPWGMLPLRLGATSWGTLGFQQFGLDRLGPTDIQVWAGYWFTRGNAVLCHNGPEPIDFSVDPLPHGFRRPLPASSAVAGLDLPAFAASGAATVVASMECDGRPGCGTTMRILRTAAEQRLRHGLGLSYSVGEFTTRGGNGSGLCFLYADALPEHAADVSNGLWQVLTRFAEGGPTRDELDHEIEIARRHLQDSEAHPALMPYLAGQALEGVSAEEALRAIEAPLALQPSEVQDIARELRGSALFTGPQGSAPTDAALHPYPYLAAQPLAGEALKTRGFEVPGELRVGPDGVSLALVEGPAVNARFGDIEVVQRWRNGDLILITRNADRVWVLNRHYHDVASVGAAVAAAVPADRFVDYTGEECPFLPGIRAPRLRPAPLLQRAIAAVLDAFNVVGVFILAIMATEAAFAVLGWDRKGADEGAFTAISFGVWYLVTWLFFALFESRRGATPGKHSRNLVVVGQDESRISFLRASARFFVASAGIAVAGIGSLLILCSRKRHALQDIVTRTEVMEQQTRR